ncbi:MAG TPA: type I restriction enzyme HsdR N-terminal domain-containing protein [Nitrospirota bacterium]
MEDEFVSREKKILTILEQEIEDGEEMSAAVRHIAERLLLEEKGYASPDIRKNVVFDVTLDAETAKSSVDFVVSLDNRIGMLIKCAPGSLDSRERHIVAAARVFDVLPVPMAVVMDPVTAVVLDTATGKVAGEGFDAIPTKEQLRVLLAGKEPKPIAPEKLEREKRVLLAFDAIRCCIPRGGQGGVPLE